jgi:hypothetical protein
MRAQLIVTIRSSTYPYKKKEKEKEIYEEIEDECMTKIVKRRGPVIYSSFCGCNAKEGNLKETAAKITFHCHRLTGSVNEFWRARGCTVFL